MVVKTLELVTYAGFPCKACELLFGSEEKPYAEVVTLRHARTAQFAPLRDIGIGKWTRTGVFYVVIDRNELKRENVEEAVNGQLARTTNVMYNIRYLGQLSTE